MAEKENYYILHFVHKSTGKDMYIKFKSKAEAQEYVKDLQDQLDKNEKTN